MRDVRYPDHRIYRDEEVLALTRSFVERVCGLVLIGYEERIRNDLVWVWKVHAEEGGKPVNQWIVGGDVPFMPFRTEEIATPEEALALYAWFVQLWLFQSGRGIQIGDLPAMWLPPDWKPMEFDPERATWLGLRNTQILRGMVAEMGSRIHHPEIRERIERIGVRLDPPDAHS